jgi:hypothetical protein
MSESAARASVYVFAVSSALVALGFIGQVSDVGEVFDVFALTVLPTLYLLGSVTYVRLVECGAEDFRYGLAINRIRHYYKEIARNRAHLFLLSDHDDGVGVFANMGLPAEGRKPYFAFSSAILVINSVVGGAAVALALGEILDASLGLAAGPADKHRTSGGHDFRECVRCQEIGDPVHRVAGTGDEAVKRHRPVHDHLASVGAHITRSFPDSWGP